MASSSPTKSALETLHKCSPSKCVKCHFTSVFRTIHEPVHQVKQDTTKRLRCPHCPFSCDFILHFRIHSSCHPENLKNCQIRLYHCGYCHFLFNEADQIEDHHEDQHKESQLKYETTKLVPDQLMCAECAIALPTEIAYLKHLEERHGTGQVEMYIKDMYNTSVKIVDVIEASSKSTLIGTPEVAAHTLVILKNKEDRKADDGEEFDSTFGQSGAFVGIAQTLGHCSPKKCSKCSYTTMFDLLNVIHECVHNIKQEKTKNFRCKSCPYSCDTVADFQRHSHCHAENQGKNKIRIYHCAYCNLSVNHIDTIEAHLEGTHGNQLHKYDTELLVLTEIPCSQCKEVFIDQTTLLEHFHSQGSHCSIAKHLKEMYGIVAIDTLHEKFDEKIEQRKDHASKYILLEIVKDREIIQGGKKKSKTKTPKGTERSCSGMDDEEDNMDSSTSVFTQQAQQHGHAKVEKYKKKKMPLKRKKRVTKKEEKGTTVGTSGASSTGQRMMQTSGKKTTDESSSNPPQEEEDTVANLGEIWTLFAHTQEEEESVGEEDLNPTGSSTANRDDNDEEDDRIHLRCIHCSYTAPLKAQTRMKQHVMVHLNYRPFDCYHCSFRGITQYDVKKHISKSHPGLPDIILNNKVPETESSLKDNFIRENKANILEEHQVVVTGEEKVGITNEGDDQKQTKLTKINLKTPTSQYSHSTLKPEMDQKMLTMEKKDCPSTPNLENILKCNYCSYTTPSDAVTQMKRHVKNELNYKPFKCLFCTYCAVTLKNVKNHISEEHPGRGMFVNKNRNLEFEASLDKHYTIERRRADQDDTISSDASPPNGNGSKGSRKATGDGKGSKRPKLEKGAGSKSKQLKLEAVFSGISSVSQSASNFTISDGKQFLSKSDKQTTQKMKVTASATLTLDTDSFVSEVLQEATSTRADRNTGPFLQCLHCEYTTYDGASRMKQHVMRHINYKPYQCVYCPYSAIQSNTVKSHISSKHPGQDQDYRESREAATKREGGM